MNRLHERSTCPECGGPKSPTARRCAVCAGVAPRKPALHVVEPAAPEWDHWVITCLNCAREEFLELSIGHLPTYRVRCQHCGGWRAAETYEPHQLQSVELPMRGALGQIQEAA